MFLLLVGGMFLDWAIPVARKFPLEALKKLPATVVILLVFGVLVLLVATLAAVQYWAWLHSLWSRANVLFSVSLLLAIVGGVFTSVIAKNYKQKRPFSKVTAFQLLFPLVFVPMVIFAIFVTGEKIGIGQNPFFGLCAAFTYGYFWERVVEALDPTKEKG